MTTDLNHRFFETGDEVAAVTRARLHAGGPYGDTHNRVTAILQSRPLMLKESAFQNFQFDTIMPKAPPEETVYQTENKLNNQGDADSKFQLVEGKILYGRLMVESAVRDDRGKSIAGRSLRRLCGSGPLRGASPPGLDHDGRPAGFRRVAGDGWPGKSSFQDVPIQVTLSRRETKAARVKGAGNAYITHYTHEWVVVDQVNVISAKDPVSCSLTPQNPGSHRITATIKDS